MTDSIKQELPIGELTKDWVVSVMLDTDDANKVNGRGIRNQIVRVLTEFFTSDNIKTDEYSRLSLPNNRGMLQLYKADLSDEPMIQERNEPLIVFSGLSAVMYPDEDIPKMVKKSLREKFLIKNSGPVSLLVWSEHMALTSFDKKIVEAINKYSIENSHSYEQIVYISLFNQIYHILPFK